VRHDIDSLISGDTRNQTVFFKEDGTEYWVEARPIFFGSFWERLSWAFDVFVEKADAVYWHNQ
jgi:hypothetical protein